MTKVKDLKQLGHVSKLPASPEEAVLERVASRRERAPR